MNFSSQPLASPSSTQREQLSPYSMAGIGRSSLRITLQCARKGQRSRASASLARSCRPCSLRMRASRSQTCAESGFSTRAFRQNSTLQWLLRRALCAMPRLVQARMQFGRSSRARWQHRIASSGMPLLEQEAPSLFHRLQLVSSNLIASSNRLIVRLRFRSLKCSTAVATSSSGWGPGTSRSVVSKRSVSLERAMPTLSSVWMEGSQRAEQRGCLLIHSPRNWRMYLSFLMLVQETLRLSRFSRLSGSIWQALARQAQAWMSQSCSCWILPRTRQALASSCFLRWASRASMASLERPSQSRAQADCRGLGCESKGLCSAKEQTSGRGLQIIEDMASASTNSSFQDLRASSYMDSMSGEIQFQKRLSSDRSPSSSFRAFSQSSARVFLPFDSGRCSTSSLPRISRSPLFTRSTNRRNLEFLNLGSWSSIIVSITDCEAASTRSRSSCSLVAYQWICRIVACSSITPASCSRCADSQPSSIRCRTSSPSCHILCIDSCSCRINSVSCPLNIAPICRASCCLHSSASRKRSSESFISCRAACISASDCSCRPGLSRARFCWGVWPNAEAANWRKGLGACREGSHCPAVKSVLRGFICNLMTIA